MSENKYPIGGDKPGEDNNKCPECGGLNGGHGRYNCSLMTLEYAQKTIVEVEQRWIKLSAMSVSNFQCTYNRLKKLIAFYQGKMAVLKAENNKLRKQAMKPKPAGAVWVKGDYDRLYEQLKADVNCRIVCYVDHVWHYKSGEKGPTMRDICTIWGENMEFGSRGHGYGSVRFMPGDYKTNFIGLCEEMNVEWLDEQATDNDAVGFAEWISKQGYYPDDGKWVDNAFTEIAVTYTTAELYKLYQESKK